MIQLFVILSFLIWIISILGYGSTLINIFSIKKLNIKFEINDEVKIITYGFFGFIIIFIISIISNFFIALNSVFSISILSAGIILFVFNFKKAFSWAKWFDLAIISFLFLYSSIFTLMDIKSYDTGLFYLPTILWDQQNPLPIGLANLQGGFGFNSSWFVVAAIISPLKFFTKDYFFIVNAIVYFLYGTAIFLCLKNNLFKKLSLSTCFLMFSFIPWFLINQEYTSSPKPDFAVMLLVLFISYLLISAFEKKYDSDILLFLAFIFSIFTLTIKISSVVYGVGLFLILIFSIIKKYLNNKGLKNSDKINSYFLFTIIIFGSLIVLPWIIKSILLSGCIIYPSAFGHFSNLKWAVSIDQIKNEVIWTKGWSRMPMVKDPASVLVNWDWLIPWAKRIIGNEKVLINFSIIALFTFLVSLFRRVKFEKISSFIVPLIISICSICFWFLSAPDPRYAYGYLFSFCLLFFCIGFIRLSGIFENIFNIIKSIKYLNLILIIIGVCLITFGTLLYLNIINDYLIKFGEFLIRRPFNYMHVWRHKLIDLAYLSELAGFLCFIIVINKLELFGKVFPKLIILIYGIFFLILGNEAIIFKEALNTNKTPKIEFVSHTTNDGVVIYSPKKGDQCWDAPLPATAYFNPDIKINIDNNGFYRLFWFDKND